MKWISWKMRSVWLPIILCSVISQAYSAEGERNPIPIAVIDLDYVDTSGETADQGEAHSARLQLFMKTLRDDLDQSGAFKVIPMTCDPEPCSITDSDPESLVGTAKKSGAKLMLFGGIHKMSTLIQFAKVQVVDVERNELVMQRSLSFRGDDDRSWLRAEKFLTKQLTEELAK